MHLVHAEYAQGPIADARMLQLHLEERCPQAAVMPDGCEQACCRTGARCFKDMIEIMKRVLLRACYYRIDAWVSCACPKSMHDGSVLGCRAAAVIAIKSSAAVAYSGTFPPETQAGKRISGKK